MISNCISEDIPFQMKILNMVIPILMPFCSFVSKLKRCKLHKAACHPTKRGIINDINYLRQYITEYNYCRKCLRYQTRRCVTKARALEWPLTKI